MSSNSSNHWCKQVIETVLPKNESSFIPPPPKPPNFVSKTNESINSNSFSNGPPVSPTNYLSLLNVNPTYLQYYQQYYQSSGLNVPNNYLPSPIPVIPSPIPPSNLSPASISKISSDPLVTTDLESKNSKQPQSLKDFISKSFVGCKSEVERKYITDELSKLINRVSNDGRMFIHRWDLEPIPTFFDPISDSKITQISTHSSESIKKRKSRWGEDDPSSTRGPCNQINNLDDLKSSKAVKRLKVSNSIKAGINENPGMEINFDDLKIVGTCLNLEKEYFRLTSPPLSNSVRPEHILKKSLQLMKQKWDNDDADYLYLCSQLKSIRQDLTVQHIRNDFTVHVYETHARIALESGDLNEYNQCQTQLIHLYASGLKGSEIEFVAYRILYYIYLLGNSKYKAGNSDLAFLLTSLPNEVKRHESVIHALSIRQCIQQENYHNFFRLYKKTPNLGSCILDLILDSIRLRFLQRICKSYKPNVSLLFVIEELGFQEYYIAIDFLLKLGCLFQVNGNNVESIGDYDASDIFLNTKDSIIDSATIFTQEKLLL